VRPWWLQERREIAGGEEEESLRRGHLERTGEKARGLKIKKQYRPEEI